jgi:predicted methyltransferase
LYSSELKRREFQKSFGIDPLKAFSSIFKKLQKEGLIVIDELSIKPTDLGKRHLQTMLYEFYSKTHDGDKLP